MYISFNILTGYMKFTSDKNQAFKVSQAYAEKLKGLLDKNKMDGIIEDA